MAATPLRHANATDAVAWLHARDVRGLSADSRRVQPGDAFIAWPGYGHDGRQFVPAALTAGAAACLVEASGVEAFGFDGERVASLAGLKAHTGEIASRFFGEPSRQLSVVAVTGTNGKTSVSWWVAQALSLLGQRCGVIGTLGVGEPPSAASPQAEVRSTGLTTPDPVTLQSAFRRFADDGFAACAIEASSIGIVESRLSGTQIAVALFTNFTRDHLDFHDSMTSYWAAKAQLFDWPGLRAAVMNIDDEQGAALAKQLASSALDVWTYSSSSASARLQARDVEYRDGGLAFTVAEGDAVALVSSSLIGDYNVSNLLAMIGGLRALGVPLAEAAAVCSQLTPVPGRMQRVEMSAPRSRMTETDPPRGSSPASGGRALGLGGHDLPTVVVDYAHTPDALEKALQALRPFAIERGGKLWSVFGCGGNRDATKRPLMGAIAERLADQVVVTSDNPRLESPTQILTQIVRGMTQVLRAAVIEDRRAAIGHAIKRAAANDVVLIAGKGHEAEQDIAGVKHPFSDVREAQLALAERAAA